jgi:glycosyltransferase involved in cell wall biosynthesis
VSIRLAGWSARADDTSGAALSEMIRSMKQAMASELMNPRTVPLRVLHVISSLSPAGGGPPEAVRQLAKAYCRAGILVEVVCLDKPDEPFLKDINCTVHALGERFFGRFAFSPRLWQWLRKKAAKYDAIVVNGIWTFIGLAARCAARHARLPYGVFIHGALDPWFNKQYPLKRLKKSLYWPIQYRVLRDARAVFFTTDVERDLAERSFSPNRWRGTVVPYGVGDPDHPQSQDMSPAAQVKVFYNKLPKLCGRRHLLFLGRIHEKKGCDLLVQAFAELAVQEPDVDLVIAGPDQVGLQPKLQEMCAHLGISSRVHWPGQIVGELKWGALRTCDAFVLPSHQENFGIAVVEALAVGRPVLISNQVNIWRDVVKDRAGFADDDTMEGTKRLMSRWFAMSPAERDEYAVNARPSFLRRFAIGRAVDVIVGALLQDSLAH